MKSARRRCMPMPRLELAQIIAMGKKALSWSMTKLTTLLAAIAIATAHPDPPNLREIDCAVGAWLGHDGFQWPGSGDYFHQLHHKHFDCNYGAMHFPMDKWFGTFADSSKAVSKIWAATKAKTASKKSSPKSKSKSNSVDQVTPRARSSASPRRSARLAAK
jgi:hypothetical protein